MPGAAALEIGDLGIMTAQNAIDLFQIALDLKKAAIDGRCQLVDAGNGLGEASIGPVPHIRLITTPINTADVGMLIARESCKLVIRTPCQILLSGPVLASGHSACHL